MMNATTRQPGAVFAAEADRQYRRKIEQARVVGGRKRSNDADDDINRHLPPLTAWPVRDMHLTRDLRSR
jgi:hypothetical protein